jgi:hypothetical protein
MSLLNSSKDLTLILASIQNLTPYNNMLLQMVTVDDSPFHALHKLYMASMLYYRL